jgi:post-segregation antitoxin (ccd killing protein)
MPTTTKRVTVTLPADLVDRIDRLERNRSRFVAEAVRNELARCRRAELQRSLASPHPETVEHTEMELDAWSEGLLEGDAALVDPAAGYVIRWDEDAGWREEPT